MRTILIMFFILSCLALKSQVNTDTVTISGLTKFKRIPTCFGENCMSGESCSPTPNNAVANGAMVYEDANIGKIKHGMMICQTMKGICTKTMILVNDADGVSRAGKQAAKQFGEPVYTKEGSIYVYAWKYIPSNEKEIKIRLEVAADLQHAKLFVE